MTTPTDTDTLSTKSSGTPPHPNATSPAIPALTSSGGGKSKSPMRMTPCNIISIKFVTGIDHRRVGTHHLLSFLPGSDPATAGELLYTSPTNFQINIALQHRHILHAFTLIHELIHVLLFLVSPSLRPHKTYDRLWLTAIEPTYLLLTPKDKPYKISS